MEQENDLKPGEAPVEDLQEELSRLRDALARQEESASAYLEQIKRLQADFENWRKRVEQEKLLLTETAAAALILKLLPVMDNFERALAHTGGSESDKTGAIRDGMSLIYRQMTDLLKEEGLTPIEAVGKPFDPTLHEAYAHEEQESGNDHEVIEEARKGYLLKGRLLRPSLVKVSIIPVKSNKTGG